MMYMNIPVFGPNNMIFTLAIGLERYHFCRVNKLGYSPLLHKITVYYHGTFLLNYRKELLLTADSEDHCLNKRLSKPSNIGPDAERFWLLNAQKKLLFL